MRRKYTQLRALPPGRDETRSAWSKPAARQNAAQSEASRGQRPRDEQGLRDERRNVDDPDRDAGRLPNGRPPFPGRHRRSTRCGTCPRGAELPCRRHTGTRTLRGAPAVRAERRDADRGARGGGPTPPHVEHALDRADGLDRVDRNQTGTSPTAPDAKRDGMQRVVVEDGTLDDRGASARGDPEPIAAREPVRGDGARLVERPWAKRLECDLVSPLR